MTSLDTSFHQGPYVVAKAFRRFVGFVAPGICLLFGLGLSGLDSARAITVADSTGWNAWNSGLTGNYLADPGADQQTGQGTDDYIGNATTPAMMQQAGLLNGVSSIMFRARMGKFEPSSKGFGAGNGANLSLGIDLNNNGSLDLIVDMSAKGFVETISFAAPGAGANTGPSTTSWGNFYGAITLTNGVDYDYRQVTDGVTLNSNGTPVAGTENGSTASSYTANAWVTFAISYANLQAAIRAYAVDNITPGSPVYFTNYVLTDTNWLSFIGFTSTQGNAINQDLLGTEGNTNSTLTFSDLGASTTYIRPGGGPVPEPASVFQLGGLLGTGLILWAWRRRQAAHPAGSSTR